MLERGTLLNNRYRIIDILGQGGMGSVYRAIDENLGVEVAVKDNLFTTEEYARQFRREAVILANLRHPNLPRVTDHFVITGQGQYLVMDYIEGEDLRQRVERQGPISDEEAITIGAAVCDALAYLGSRKPPIIHRDIKPGNVKITPQGQIFLVDFGLAKTLQGSQSTTTGARAMTPGFSPPEQYGTARTDQRSDIFSLGATLYAALTGATPEDALARAMDQEELTPIRKHQPKVNKRLAAAIEKALEVRPENRYQTAEEFKAALLEASSVPRRKEGDFTVQPAPPPGEGVEADSALVPASARLEAALAEGEAASEPISVPFKEVRRSSEARRRTGRARRWGCLLLSVLIIGFLSGGSFLALQRDPLFFHHALGRLVALAVARVATPTAVITVAPITQTASLEAVLPAPSDTAPPPPTDTAVWTPTIAPTATPSDTPTPVPTPMGGGIGQLAFVSNISGTNQIYIINVDGTGMRQVTDMAEGACQPTWAPDGQRLAFTSPCSSNKDFYPNSNLYMIGADGSGLKALTTEKIGDFDPAWSPDGKTIAFTSLRNNRRSQIYLLNVESGEITRLSDEYNFDMQPSWSWDGRQIIFASTRRGISQIWIMDADGQNQVLFSQNQVYQNFKPALSPDNQIVVFTQLVALGGVPRVMVAPFKFDRYTEFRLGQETMPMREAVFSPDGFWIAVEGWTAGSSHEIYVISSSGTTFFQVTQTAGIAFDPAWNPAGFP